MNPGMTSGMTSLTPADDLMYLLAIQQKEEKKMQGRIRTKEKCPVCRKPFSYIPKLGFLCSPHKTTPTRFFLDLFYQGKRLKIYSDKQGQVLDSYRRASDLLARINHEIDNHAFDPTKYLRGEQEKFWVANLLDRFLAHKKESIAPSYLANYQAMTRAAKDFFGINDIREMRKLDLVSYKENLEKKQLMGKTLKNYLSLFKTFLRYCQNDLEIVASIPTMPQVEVQESKFKWLPQEDQVRLYEHVQEDDKPIFAFLMLHGCRPSEARALKVKDVDKRLKTITISATFSGAVYRQRRKGRGARSVTIPIHPEMADFIIQKASKNLPEAFLFANPRTGKNYSKTALERVWANAREKAGIVGLRLYDATRHSFASNLVNNGTSIFKVSRLLGHSSISMTEKYSHQNIESLRIDLQKLSLAKVATVPRVSPEQKMGETN